MFSFIFWAGACGSSPTTPSTPPVSETLTGTLSPTNSNVHQFSAAAGGTLTITLVSLTPPVTAVGLGLGAVSNGSCTLQYTNTPFTAGAIWTTTLAGQGTYCLVIYDIGYLTQDESYSIKIDHP
ncbi:MAG: hypothetical protein ACHQO8_05515 [Vicinamibacterales bacterium]